MLHKQRMVFLDQLIEVALRMDEDLLSSGCVLEAQLVVSAAARRALRAPAAARLVRRQHERRRVRAIVQTAKDHGLVGVAALEDDDDFHPEGGDRPNTHSGV